MHFTPKTVLFTRPSHDLGTNYLKYWTKPLIDLAGSKGHSVIDVQDNKVKERVVHSYLRKQSPSLVVLNGHGAPHAMGGADDKTILDIKSSTLLKDKVIYARSCNTADLLGPEGVKNGAKAYIGYTKPFYMCYDKDKIHHPLEDTVAAYVLEPSNQVVASLLKGHTAKEASESSKSLSKRKLAELMSSNAPEGAAGYLQCVWFNMRHQVCLGNPEAKL